MINVFVDYFQHPNILRAQEIDTCIQRNKDNKNINYQLINYPHRMTYQDFFDYINKSTIEDDVNIVSNIDIIFDDTIALLEKIKPNQFMALTRHELKRDGSSYFEVNKAKYSQDVWAWRGRCKITTAHFNLGVLRCDNRLAFEALEVGYELINPAFSIKVYHLHFIEVRVDEYFNAVPGRQYFVFPQTWI